MNDLPGDQILEILKWIGIVFIAGFIGYFGRYLSMMIIDRIQRKKRAETTSAPPGEKIVTVATSSETDIAQQKIEKKRLKAEQKRAKKEKG